MQVVRLHGVLEHAEVLARRAEAQGAQDHGVLEIRAQAGQPWRDSQRDEQRMTRTQLRALLVRHQCALALRLAPGTAPLAAPRGREPEFSLDALRPHAHRGTRDAEMFARSAFFSRRNSIARPSRPPRHWRGEPALSARARWG